MKFSFVCKKKHNHFTLFLISFHFCVICVKCSIPFIFISVQINRIVHAFSYYIILIFNHSFFLNNSVSYRNHPVFSFGKCLEHILIYRIVLVVSFVVFCLLPPFHTSFFFNSYPRMGAFNFIRKENMQQISINHSISIRKIHIQKHLHTQLHTHIHIPPPFDPFDYHSKARVIFLLTQFELYDFTINV